MKSKLDDTISYYQTLLFECFEWEDAPASSQNIAYSRGQLLALGEPGQAAYKQVMDLQIAKIMGVLTNEEYRVDMPLSPTKLVHILEQLNILSNDEIVVNLIEQLKPSLIGRFYYVEPSYILNQQDLIQHFAAQLIARFLRENISAKVLARDLQACKSSGRNVLKAFIRDLIDWDRDAFLVKEALFAELHQHFCLYDILAEILTELNAPKSPLRIIFILLIIVHRTGEPPSVFKSHLQKIITLPHPDNTVSEPYKGTLSHLDREFSVFGPGATPSDEQLVEILNDDFRLLLTHKFCSYFEMHKFWDHLEALWKKEFKNASDNFDYDRIKNMSRPEITCKIQISIDTELEIILSIIEKLEKRKSLPPQETKKLLTVLHMIGSETQPAKDVRERIAAENFVELQASFYENPFNFEKFKTLLGLGEATPSRIYQNNVLEEVLKLEERKFMIQLSGNLVLILKYFKPKALKELLEKLLLKLSQVKTKEECDHNLLLTRKDTKSRYNSALKECSENKRVPPSYQSWLAEEFDEDSYFYTLFLNEEELTDNIFLEMSASLAPIRDERLAWSVYGGNTREEYNTRLLLARKEKKFQYNIALQEHSEKNPEMPFSYESWLHKTSCQEQYHFPIFLKEKELTDDFLKKAEYLFLLRKEDYVYIPGQNELVSDEEYQKLARSILLIEPSALTGIIEKLVHEAVEEGKSYAYSKLLLLNQESSEVQEWRLRYDLPDDIISASVQSPIVSSLRNRFPETREAENTEEAKSILSVMFFNQLNEELHNGNYESIKNIVQKIGILRETEKLCHFIERRIFFRWWSHHSNGEKWHANLMHLLKLAIIIFKAPFELTINYYDFPPYEENIGGKNNFRDYLKKLKPFVLINFPGVITKVMNEIEFSVKYCYKDSDFIANIHKNLNILHSIDCDKALLQKITNFLYEKFCYPLDCPPELVLEAIYKVLAFSEIGKSVVKKEMQTLVWGAYKYDRVFSREALKAMNNAAVSLSYLSSDSNQALVKTIKTLTAEILVPFIETKQEPNVFWLNNIVDLRVEKEVIPLLCLKLQENSNSNITEFILVIRTHLQMEQTKIKESVLPETFLLTWNAITIIETSSSNTLTAKEIEGLLIEIENTLETQATLNSPPNKNQVRNS